MNSLFSYILICIMRYLSVLKEKQKRFSQEWLCSIFQGPIVTDKAYSQSASNKVYSVKVHKDANKISITQAFKQLFNINPVSVNVLVQKGKQKRRRTKAKEITIQRPNFKKAMIKLPADANFDFGLES